MNSIRGVLYLSYDGLTDPLGQSQILPYLVGLSSNGNKFIVISFEKKKNYSKLKDEVENLCRKSNITWVPLHYHKWPPIFSTLFDLWILSSKVKRILDHNRIAIIHCRSYITSMIGLAVKRRRNIKFIFDMRGFWADERVEGGLWNLKNPLYKMVYLFFKKKEKQFLVEANHVVSLTHNAKKEIESWNIKNAPITVIPTCGDLDLFDPNKIKKEDQGHLRSKLGIQENDFVLLYLGSWGTWYLTQEMLDFFSTIKKEKANAKFLIISPDQIELENYFYKDDVIVTTAARKEVPLYISIAQASVCFVKPTFSKKASSATKMGEIMAMNIPVIVNGGWGDMEMMINNYSVIDRAFLKFENLINVNSRGRDSFVEDLGLNTGISRYEEIYGRLA